MDHEVQPKLENVQMLDKYNARNPSTGTLYFATTHLIFVDHEQKKETWILLMHISSVERLPITTGGSPLLIRTKTFHSVFFVIPRERDCHEMHQTLLQLCQPAHIEELYCFNYKAPVEGLPKSAGWGVFDILDEYKRMGVPNEQWVLCDANYDYELCDTYPRHIFVPVRATSAVLGGSARFRSRGRLPVLAYLHTNRAALARCSQPLSGFSARCLEDEQMLDCIRRANPNCGYMYVVDTRPKINAMVNRAAGKGYENEAFYDNIKFQFMGIGNIHVMRKSLKKLVETCEQNTPSMSPFLSGLESSGWLKHIKAILETAWWIANSLDSGISVVVHCSDGWDRTAQACSIAQLMLNPRYRTIKGYQALIEKDWLAFGHKFSDRCGHVAGDHRERAPIFTQLLDCTWQLLRIRPEAFEFNERFLLTLHDHVHSCQYGTFIANCQRERGMLKIAERTFSLWGYMASHVSEYKNPLYDPRACSDVLKPDLSSQNIRFWLGMYCRYEDGVHPRDVTQDLLLASVDHTSALEGHIKYLTKHITSFKSYLSNYGRDMMTKPNDVTATPVNFQNGTVDSININRDIDDMTTSLSDISCANNSHPLIEAASSSLENSNNSEDPSDYVIIEGGVPVADLLKIEKEVNSVAIDWKSLKNVKECACSTPFDNYSRKHCWGCGRVCCARCLSRSAPTAALSTPTAADSTPPLCMSCRSNTP